ncbi:hypothetical protein Efla_001016 [Eimeria flavescens]
MLPDTLKRVRSEGCVLRRQPLVRNSPMPLTSCYRLEEVIGRGSFGSTVFAAVDLLSGVRRVVKCVRREEPDGIRLWRNEVRFLRMLDHPNVLRLFEVFEEGEAVSQVTETCHGGDLHQWVDRRLRRRRRRARKLQSAPFVEPLTSLLPTPQEGLGGSLACRRSGVYEGQEEVPRSASPATQETPKTDSPQNDVAFYRTASGSSRGGGSTRSVCPAALGAAAAAATAAAAASASVGGMHYDADALHAPPAPPLVREELAARLMGQVLSALRYLHEKEIAHCDIKLENVLLLNELEDSEAGDGQSSDEEETEMRREEEEQQRQLRAQQQQQEMDAAALFRARRGLRARSNVHIETADCRDASLSKAVASSSSLSSLTVVPLVLRKRRNCREARERGLEEASCSSSSQSLFDDLSRRDVRVKLADFGLARKIVKAKPLKYGRTACEGTLYYRSPWIIRGMTDGDARSDLWAVGVALFILLSGTPPFNGNDEQEVERAISETPVSFRGGVWSSVSLQCVGFLRALLYNPILPLHLRGPPPPPPYTHPTADLMLKHPWIQQCVREQRRRGLMRALSAPSIQHLGNVPRGFGASGGASHYPLTWASRCEAFEASSRYMNLARLQGCWRLGHPPQGPSEPCDTQRVQLARFSHPCNLVTGGSSSDTSVCVQRSPASSVGARAPLACSTCTAWNCVFGCCAVPRRHAGAQKLRICWGRAPLVADGALSLNLQFTWPQSQAARPESVEEMWPTSPIDMVVDGAASSSSGSHDQRAAHEAASSARCALRAAGVSSFVCTTCKGTEPSSFRYEEVHPQALSDMLGPDSDGDAEQLQPHLRLLRTSSPLHGLESCAAATNAAAAAAAAAAGVAKAVRREAEKRTAEHLRQPLGNVPHFHLRMQGSATLTQRRSQSGEDGATRESTEQPGESVPAPCCIAVVHWLTAELFEARVPLLLQACAWLDFARLSPLQRALRSVVVKLMEEDIAVKLIRDVMWVLDPQQSGSVSRQCLLDSLKVVRDFFSLEFALRGIKDCNADSALQESGGAESTGLLIQQLPGSQSPDRSPSESEFASLFFSGCATDKAVSPLQAMQVLAALSPGELPPLDVLKPYYAMLQRALEPQFPSTMASPGTVNSEVEAVVIESFPSDASASAATGDSSAQRCELDEALVCLDTDGSGGIEVDEFLAASMTRADFKDREPACSVAFRLLDRNLDGFVSANDLLSILHFDAHSDLQGVLQTQKKRADAAVAACKAAIAAAKASGTPPPAGSLLDDSELVTGRDEHGKLMSVPAGASFILQLENVNAATVQLYVEVARELKAMQHRSNGLWTLEEFTELL